MHIYTHTCLYTHAYICIVHTYTHTHPCTLTYTEFHHETPLYTTDFSKAGSRNEKKTKSKTAFLGLWVSPEDEKQQPISRPESSATTREGEPGMWLMSSPTQLSPLCSLPLSPSPAQGFHVQSCLLSQLKDGAAEVLGLGSFVGTSWQDKASGSYSECSGSH